VGRRSRGMLIGRDTCLICWVRSWTFGTLEEMVEVEWPKAEVWTSPPLEVWIPLSLSKVETSALSFPGWTSCTSSRMCEDGITDEYLLYTLAL